MNNVAHSVGLRSDLIDPEHLSSAPGPPTVADLEEHHVDVPQDEVAHFLCYDCGESFPTALSLGRHRRSKHKVRRLGFSYAGEDGMCNACGTLYHDRRRLVQHFNYSSKQCLAGYIAHGKPFEDEDIVSLDKKLKKLCKGQPRIADKPAVQAFGPVFPPPSRYDIDVALADGALPRVVDMPALNRIDWSVPKPIDKQPLIFLSLCSGLRRHGDPHEYVEKLAAKHNRPVLCLSLDIGIDSVKGDILSKTARKRILRWCRSGQVVGLVIGPPCETWTAARFLLSSWGP